jgi:DNA helicase HerA-like ATPase
MRVAKFVEEVTHRGRKRNYGILLATQSPADIAQSIVGLCETKMFFRVAGHQTWLKEHVGSKEVVKSISNLPNFQAYIIVKGSSREPVAIGFPNVSDGQLDETAGREKRQEHENEV